MSEEKMEASAPRQRDLLPLFSELNRIAGFLACLLIPFLGGNHLALHFVTIDRFWLETSFVLFLLIALFAHVVTRTGPEGCSRVLCFLLYFLPLFSLCALSLVYTWSAFNTLAELNTLVWALGGAFLYLLAERKKELLQALVLGSLLLVLCAVIQLNMLLPELSSTFRDGRYGAMVREQVAPFASYLNQNMLGGYFLFTLPIAFSLALIEGRRVYLCVAAALVLGILLSLSRLSAVIGFGGLCCAFVLTRRMLDRRRLLQLVFAFASAVLIFFLLLSGERREGNSTMRNLFDVKVDAAYRELPTLDKRTEIWGLSLMALAAEPLMGHGAGAFEYAYRKVHDGGLYTKYAHGSPVKIAVELGIFGLVAYLLYLSGVARGVIRAPREPGWAFLPLSVAGGALFSFLDFSFDIPAHVVTFFMLSSSFLAPAGTVRGRLPRTKLVVIPALVILALSFLFTLRADLSRKLVEDGILFEESGLLTEAYLAYRDAVEAMPLYADGYARMIAVLTKSYANERDERSRRQLCRAVHDYAEKARQLREKNAELLAVRGMAYSMCRPGEDACRYLLRARELYPSSAHYTFEAAGCFARLGDFGRALEIARFAGVFTEKMKASGNPDGLFVYKLRDLEADLEFRLGNRHRALVLQRKNLASAEAGEFSVAHAKAREFLQKDVLIAYLQAKVRHYETASTEAVAASPHAPSE
ncbi:MAG: O-antigen ligase family protein [candidate division WOR-3 bacterium]